VHAQAIFTFKDVTFPNNSMCSVICQLPGVSASAQRELGNLDENLDLMSLFNGKQHCVVV